MNWLIRIGQWMESRRVLRKPDLDSIKNNYALQEKWMEGLFKGLSDQVELFRENFDSRLSEVSNSNQIPQTIAKEFALLKARLDRVELLTGLKREPEPTHVKGAARIE